jgi:hypothetical protein
VGFPLQSLAQRQLENQFPAIAVAISGARNCPPPFRSANQPDAIVEQLRALPPSFFAARRKKTRLYHLRLPPSRLQLIVTLAGIQSA